MRTRIKGLVAVVIASAAIAGALAAPASAAPILEATWTCAANGVPLGPSTLVGTPHQVHQGLHQLRSVTCDKGTLEYTITRR
jgi:hypothetical protein